MKQKRKQIMCRRKVLKKNREEFYACEREEFIFCFGYLFQHTLKSWRASVTHTHTLANPFMAKRTEPNASNMREEENTSIIVIIIKGNTMPSYAYMMMHIVECRILRTYKFH